MSYPIYAALLVITWLALDHFYCRREDREIRRRDRLWRKKLLRQIEMRDAAEYACKLAEDKLQGYLRTLRKRNAQGTLLEANTMKPEPVLLN